jgi:glutaredoxin
MLKSKPIRDLTGTPMSTAAVCITLYRWAGRFGPLNIKIPCGECALTRDVIEDTLANELADIPVELQLRDWLSHWWQPLLKGGWHAPIVMVEGRVISQGNALNRGVLTEAVITRHAGRSPVSGNHLFGKASCPHCQRAKGYLKRAGIDFRYHDVVKDARALYEMLARVKPLVGPSTPITVPQIWLDGQYIGGADQLSERLHSTVEPNPERGQSSLGLHDLTRHH